jgi:hypothetical protein
MTIVHHFSSPEWLKCLREHIAALSLAGKRNNSDDETAEGAVFREIVQLSAGEALLFAPEAVIGGAANEDGSGVGGDDESELTGFEKLGMGYVKIKVRGRITKDGGGSVMAK